MSLFRKLHNHTYQPFNKIYISKSALESNYKFLSELKKDISIAPVLKSNAYGHGLVEIGKIVDRFGAPYICVDSMYEGYELLKVGIKTPILITGAINSENLKIKKLPFSYIVYDIKTIEEISKHQKGAQIHLEIDTGMSRLGVQMKDLPAILEKIKKIKHIQIVGLMSHFANAEKADLPITRKQIKNFLESYSIVRDAGINPKFIHCEASAALLSPEVRNQLPITNMARVGKALYGIEPTEKYQKLKPVMRMESEIVQVKTIQKGDQVGYGVTFTAKKETRIAVLPLGYNDGVDRRLSNKGSVVVGNVVCLIIGRVSMNMTTIDVSLVSNPHVGQTATVISDEQNDPNSIENIAKKCDTIAHEMLIHIDPTTRRIVV